MNASSPNNQSNVKPADGFDAMGKPIPIYRKIAAYQLCRHEGLGSERALACTDGMAEALRRDDPHTAMLTGEKHLGLLMAYRLMAVLLNAPKPRIKVQAIFASGS